MTELRQCKRCKKERPIQEFYNEKRCLDCKKYYDEYYATHTEQEKARATRSQNKDRNRTNTYKRDRNRARPVNIILQQARQRAKIKDVPFDITVDDIEVPTVCPVLGIPLCVNEKHAKANSISLDRIVPELGYVKGNVAVISYKANTIKSNATVEELEKVLEWLKSKIDASKTWV